MTEDHNRWIVSAYDFVEHRKIEHAIKELERLQAEHPDKTFRMYRIKNVTLEIPAK